MIFDTKLHLHIKKAVIQFFLVGGYIGYQAMQGFAAQTTQITTDIQNTPDQLAIDIETDNNHDNKEYYVRFKDNAEDYLNEFNKTDDQIFNYFISQSKKAQKTQGTDQQVMYNINKLMTIMNQEMGIESVSADFKELDESGRSTIARNNVYKIKFQKEGIQNTIDKLNNSPLIEYIEPVPKLEIQQQVDPYMTAEKMWHIFHMHGLQAQQAGADTGKQIIVGIVDNAIQVDHPDIAGKILAQKDLANKDDDARPPYVGGFWDHGTHIAGSVAAINNNGIGIGAIAPNSVKLVVAKTSIDDSDGRSIATLIEGIQWVISQGANIVNLSLGGCHPHAYSKTYDDLVKSNPTVIFIAAAGNNGMNPDEQPCTTQSFGVLAKGTYGFYPAAVRADNMIAVASTTQQNIRSSFSNYGTFVDISAPGSNIYSTVRTGAYKSYNGTSMATAVASSVTSMLMSADASLDTALKVKNRLKETAIALSEAGMGSGVIDACLAINASSSFDCSFTAQDTCNNNGNCEAQETNATCPADCPAKTEEKKQEPKQEEKKEEPKNNTLGCTNHKASNYNKKALKDDGSCMFELNEPITCEMIDFKAMYIGKSGSGNYQMSFLWTINPNIKSVSLHPGGSNPLIENILSPYVVSYTKGGQYQISLMVRTIDNNITTCNIIQTIGLKGCTDPIATNFNKLATDVNNSCIYPAGKQGYVNILTNNPYSNGSFNGHFQYEGKESDISIQLELRQGNTVISSYTPTLESNGTFTIDVNTNNPKEEDYIKEGNYNLYFKVTHKRGATVQRTFPIKIQTSSLATKLMEHINKLAGNE